MLKPSIADDIYPSPFSPDQTPHLNIVGGAGTYSAIGARLFSSPPNISRRVGWIVDCGTDFPPELRSTISSWQTGVLLRERNVLTTRGWNGYGANEHRAFKYLTPKLRITASDLNPTLLSSKSFHLICSPTRCAELVESIMALRTPSLPRPLFIWEPVPDLCLPSELENTLAALRHVDVISPNHAELAALFSFDPNSNDGTESVNRRTVEDCSRKLLASLPFPGHTVSIVVRCGKDGCYIASRRTRTSTWLPAYHDRTPERVVDPTGGGNGFLGGFAVALVRTGNVVEAAKWGSVSASLCIEQVGVPVLEKEVGGKGAGGKERWNGVVVEERLKEFQERCKKNVL